MLYANSPVPLYRQLYQELRTAIEGDEFEIGRKLPSERQLAAEYGISRLTARRALCLLREEGYVRAYECRGSYVALGTSQTFDCDRLQGFSEKMVRQGMIPTSRLINSGIVPVTGKVARQLRVADFEKAVKIRRLRLANHIPVAVHTTYLPYPRCARVLEVDLEQRSLYQVLSEELGIRLSCANETFRRILGHNKDLELLALDPPAAVIQLRRQTFDPQERIVEFLEAVYRTGDYDLGFPIQSADS